MSWTFNQLNPGFWQRLLSILKATLLQVFLLRSDVEQMDSFWATPVPLGDGWEGGGGGGRGGRGGRGGLTNLVLLQLTEQESLIYYFCVNKNLSVNRWQVLWLILLLRLSFAVQFRFYILYSHLSFHGQLQPWTEVTFLSSDINRIYLIFCNFNIFYPEERSGIISYWPAHLPISILNIVMKWSQSDESRLVLAGRILHIS